jgi:hypothetical protein
MQMTTCYIRNECKRFGDFGDSGDFKRFQSRGTYAPNVCRTNRGGMQPTNRQLSRRCASKATTLVAMSMSFPPLLPSKTWRAPTVAPDFPGSSHTWRKAMAPRPLTHQPSAATVGELQLATRGNFALLNETTKLKAANDRPSLSATAAPPPSKPKLYASVWGHESSVPTFSVWRYCEKHGHAPPSMPAPPISDMKAWFAEYGKPKVDCAPGDSPDSNL